MYLRFYNKVMRNLTKTFKDKEVRIAEYRGELLFCASDVGNILGLSNVYRQIGEFKKGVHTVNTLTRGGEQDLKYITEPNLYRLIFKSRKKEAIGFQEWVFDEVLPSIRKTGKYSIPTKLKKLSTDNRNLLTKTWEECGITKKHHFIQLTLQEYKALGFDKGKRKKDMTKGELLLLSAMESMEALKLFNDPKGNYYDCKDSLHETAKLLPTNKEIINGN